jgi:hypothetical protein
VAASRNNQCRSPIKDFLDWWSYSKAENNLKFHIYELYSIKSLNKTGLKKDRKNLLWKGTGMHPPYFARPKNTVPKVNLVNTKYKLRKEHGNNKQFFIWFSLDWAQHKLGTLLIASPLTWDIFMTIHCKKKLSFFPSLAGMSLTKLRQGIQYTAKLGPIGSEYITPARE